MTQCPHSCPLLNRRDFIARSSLIVAAMALLDGCSTSPTDPLSSPFTVTLAEFPALANVGAIVRVDANSRTPLAIARRSQTTFEAFSLSCPHEGQLVVVDNRPGFPAFICTGHAATFDAEGNWTGGQRTTGLREYPVSYNAAAGTLLVSPA